MIEFLRICIIASLALCLPNQDATSKKTKGSKRPGKSQTEKKAPTPKDASRYETKANHDPDGIGKFYMGREIAQVMGHLGADWLERPEREEEEKPAKLMKLLKFRQGEYVADIGAGTGYFTFRIAEKIGTKGKVFAVDIQPEMLSLIESKRKQKKLENIELVQGIEDNPKLASNSVDTILLVDVYHEFNYPYEMTKHLVDALKPGGRLVFVEYRLEDPTVPIKTVHRMSEEQVKKEMVPHKLEHVETIATLPLQHVLIFKKPVEAEPKEEKK